MTTADDRDTAQADRDPDASSPELFERARRGDVSAFVTLIEPRLDAAFGAAYGAVRVDSEAFEAVVAAGIDTWQELPRLGSLIGMESWLRTRLVVRCRQILRRRGPVREIVVEPIGPNPLLPATRQAIVTSLETRAHSTRQAFAWWPARIAHVEPRAWLSIGAAALVVTVGALSRFGTESDESSAPPRSSSVPVVAAASELPVGRPVCATDTARVLTGDAMVPPVANPMTVSPRVVDRGVYITGSQTAPIEVWAVIAGAVSRIATVDGPGIDTTRIDDLSADGSRALLTVGHVGIRGIDAPCVDLYVVATDGSGSQRLTRYGPNEVATSPRISSDGRYVAYGHTTVDPLQASVTVIDLATSDLRPREMVCNASYSNPIRWARGGLRLAAICDGRLEVHFGPDTTARYDLPVAGGALLGLDWVGPDKVVVSAGSGVPTRTNVAIDAFDLKLDVIDRIGTVTVPGIDWTLASDLGPVSPDGRSMLLQGIQTDHPDLPPQVYVVPIRGGSPTLATSGQYADQAWSSDGQGVVYVEPDVTPGPALVRYEVGIGTVHRIATLPATYRQGVWHVP